MPRPPHGVVGVAVAGVLVRAAGLAGALAAGVGRIAGLLPLRPRMRLPLLLLLPGTPLPRLPVVPPPPPRRHVHMRAASIGRDPRRLPLRPMLRLPLLLLLLGVPLPRLPVVPPPPPRRRVHTRAAGIGRNTWRLSPPPPLPLLMPLPLPRRLVQPLVRRLLLRPPRRLTAPLSCPPWLRGARPSRPFSRLACSARRTPPHAICGQRSVCSSSAAPPALPSASRVLRSSSSSRPRHLPRGNTTLPAPQHSPSAFLLGGAGVDALRPRRCRLF